MHPAIFVAFGMSLSLILFNYKNKMEIIENLSKESEEQPISGSTDEIYINLDSNCGLGTFNPDPISHEGRELIVGGSKVRIGNWGWQVSLNYLNDTYFFCGGSLISDRWVITAAHCLYEMKKSQYSNIRVNAGVHDRTKLNSWTISSLKVSNVFIHSHYNNKTYTNDIALLKLQVPVKIDTTEYKIVPICLPKNSNNIQGQTGYATGWGAEYSGGSAVNILMQVTLPIKTDTECANTAYNLNFAFDRTKQICAGDGAYFYGGKDTCQGDSGGPLVIKNSDGRWYLAGITSFGYKCGYYAGFYTRTSAYQDWILSIIN